MIIIHDISDDNGIFDKSCQNTTKENKEGIIPLI